MRKIRKQRLILWVARGMGKTGRLLKDSLAATIPNRRVLMVRSASKRFVLRDTDVVINWGNSQAPLWATPPQLLFAFNGMHNTIRAINKLVCFQHLEGKVNIPEWTTDPQVACDWMNEGFDVICRKTLTGFGGAGIVYCAAEDHTLVADCPLYTKYKKKKYEYRVQVFNGEVIDICHKRRRRDYAGEINNKIRNIDGGWIFAREDLYIPENLEEQALLAVEALGLDFGAVDIIWNQRENKSYVLEINTAPGLMQTSLARYTQAIKDAI